MKSILHAFASHTYSVLVFPGIFWEGMCPSPEKRLEFRWCELRGLVLRNTHTSFFPHLTDHSIAHLRASAPPWVQLRHQLWDKWPGREERGTHLSHHKWASRPLPEVLHLHLDCLSSLTGSFMTWLLVFRCSGKMIPDGESQKLNTRNTNSPTFLISETNENQHSLPKANVYSWSMVSVVCGHYGWGGVLEFTHKHKHPPILDLCCLKYSVTFSP